MIACDDQNQIIILIEFYLLILLLLCLFGRFCHILVFFLSENNGYVSTIAICHWERQSGLRSFKNGHRHANGWKTHLCIFGHQSHIIEMHLSVCCKSIHTSNATATQATIQYTDDLKPMELLYKMQLSE